MVTLCAGGCLLWHLISIALHCLWLYRLLLQCGDVERNPGPKMSKKDQKNFRKFPPRPSVQSSKIISTDDISNEILDKICRTSSKLKPMRKPKLCSLHDNNRPSPTTSSAVSRNDSVFTNTSQLINTSICSSLSTAANVIPVHQKPVQCRTPNTLPEETLRSNTIVSTQGISSQPNGYICPPLTTFKQKSVPVPKPRSVYDKKYEQLHRTNRLQEKKKSYAENPNKKKEASRKLYSENPNKKKEASRKASRKSYSENPNKKKEASRKTSLKSYSENPNKKKEASRKASRKLYSENPNKKKEASRKSYSENPEKKKEALRKSYAANPDKKRKLCLAYEKQRRKYANRIAPCPTDIIVILLPSNVTLKNQHA